MDIWQDTNWFAVQAKPHQEQLAAAQVARLDIEVFLPRVSEIKSICGVFRPVTKPLFQGYFFARFAPFISIDAVRFCYGVLRILGTGRFPVPLDAEIISSIRARVCSDGLVHLEPTRFKPGDVVSIEHGPFEGFMGKIERECDDGRRVVILLEAVQHARLLIEKRWLAAENAAK